MAKALSPIERLRQLVADYGSQAAAARALGVSQPYVHDLLHGRRLFSAAMLARLGMRRETRIVAAD